MQGLFAVDYYGRNPDVISLGHPWFRIIINRETNLKNLALLFSVDENDDKTTKIKHPISHKVEKPRPAYVLLDQHHEGQARIHRLYRRAMDFKLSNFIKRKNNGVEMVFPKSWHNRNSWLSAPRHIPALSGVRCSRRQNLLGRWIK